MKKNLIFLFLLLLIVTGCSNNTQKDINTNNSKKIDDYINVEYKTKNEIKCDEMANAKLISKTIFVTNDGKIFHYGSDKLYSNEQNCKQFDDEPYTSWFGDETISEIVGLKYTELVDSKMHQILTNEEDNKIGIKGTYDYLLKNIKNWYVSSSGFIIREDNKFYLLDGEKNKQDITGNILSDDVIESVNGIVIKTNNGYYVLKSKISNKEECEKYDDVKCNYNYYIESSDILNSIKDKIVIAYTDGYNPNELFIYAKNNILYSIKI